MPEELKKVAILDILIKSDDAEKRLGELKVAQHALLAQNKELQKDYAKNSEAIALNGLRVKELAREEAVLTKITQNQTIANKAQEGSNDQLRAKLALLTTQYNKLGKEERDNTKAGQALQKQIKGISDELKKNEKAVGDTRRNVGNYKDSILEAVNASGFFNTELGKMVQGLTVGLQQGMVIAKAGFGSFSGALKGGVIGAIALATSAVAAFFTATGAGEDQLERLTARAKGAFQGIVQNLAGAAGAFGDAFRKGGSTIGALVPGISAFMKVLSSPEARDNVKKTADAYEQVAIALQKIEDAERDARVEVSKRRLEIDKLLLTSKDQNVSDEKQIANLELAKQKEIELTKDQIAFAQVRLDNANAIAATQKDKTDKVKDDVAAAQITLNELIGQSKLVIQQADNRISAQQQQIKAKMLKDLQDQITEANATLVAGLDEARAELIKRLAHNAITYFEYERELSKITLDGLKIRKQDDEKAIQDASDTDNKLAKLGIDATKEAADIAVKADQDKIQLAKQTAEELLAIKNKAIDDETKLEEAKFSAFTNIGNGLVELNRAIAGSNADSTEFGKILAGIQIAIAEAQAIAEAIRNATAAAAAGGPSAPFLQVAYIASGIASVAAAFVQARQLLEGPSVPKPEFYEGGAYGYTGDGNPRQQSKALGEKPYAYHKRELIASDAALSTEEGALAGNVLMRIMKKTPRFGIPGMFNGGVFDGGITNRNNSQSVYQEIQANNNLLRIISRLPAGEVRVVKLNRAQKEFSHVNVTKDLV